MNAIQIEKLKQTNYVRVAQPDNDYWVDFSRRKLKEVFTSKFGEEFNLIIYSKLDTEDGFYVIPFKLVQPLFKDEFLSNDKDRKPGSRRWVVTIKNHIFKVTNCPTIVDVKEYYSNPFWSFGFDEQEEENDYEIENKKQEIFVRIKQSKFRQKVLQNFNSACCISNIKEEELLVASHVIPWSDNKKTRLDPTNGLSLFILYDKLFDKGYFTITDDFTVHTIQKFNFISQALKDVLISIDGKKINTPLKKIKIEYLKYHRENIFTERV